MRRTFLPIAALILSTVMLSAFANFDHGHEVSTPLMRRTLGISLLILCLIPWAALLWRPQRGTVPSAHIHQTLICAGLVVVLHFSLRVATFPPGTLLFIFLIYGVPWLGVRWFQHLAAAGSEPDLSADPEHGRRSWLVFPFLCLLILTVAWFAAGPMKFDVNKWKGMKEGSLVRWRMVDDLLEGKIEGMTEADVLSMLSERPPRGHYGIEAYNIVKPSWFNAWDETFVVKYMGFVEDPSPVGQDAPAAERRLIVHGLGLASH